MNTRAPFTSEDLCRHFGLVVERHPLPANAAGFLDRAEQPKFVAVNSDLPPAEQEITIAHETGHFVVRHKELLSNHPWLRWINHERKHPIANQLTRVYMEEFNGTFDAEFWADLFAICQSTVLGRMDLVQAILKRKPHLAPWAAAISVAAFFRTIKRYFIPAMLRYFLFVMWI